MNLHPLSNSISAKRTTLGLGAMFAAAAALLPSTAMADKTVVVKDAPGVLARATYAGKPSPTKVLRLSLTLPPSNRAGLQAYANAVSDPKSPLYRQFLTAGQIGASYGPSASTLNVVTSYLAGKGLKVTDVNQSRMSVLVSGTVKQAEAAFGTTIGNYNMKAHEVGFRDSFYANQTPLKLPSAVAKAIVGIGGVANFIKPSPNLLTIAQTRTLYGVASLYDGGYQGQGVKVGITNYGPYRIQPNVPLFYAKNGLPTPPGGVGSNIFKVSINGSDGETIPDTDANNGGEMDLDIQMVLGMAPLCSLYLFDDAGDGDDVAVRTKEIALNVDIVTESWESNIDVVDPTYTEGVHNLQLQMTAMGITYLNASGDYGAPGRFSYPHTDPEILQVGGTIATANADGTRATETAWQYGLLGGNGAGLIFGGGGGWFNTPVSFNSRNPLDNPYQATSLFPYKSSVNRRLLPDIALNAADAGFGSFPFFYQGTEGSAVGTSFSSPVLAGQLAAMLHRLTTEGTIAPINGRTRLGRLQDFIYGLNPNPSVVDPTVFFDVTVGDIGPLPDGTLAAATTGFDLATGFGAMNIDGLRQAYVNLSGLTVNESAVVVGIFTVPGTTKPLGTDPRNGATGTDGLVESLKSMGDGVAFSLQSVRQPGLGQVAAATVDVKLTRTDRRSATAKAAISSPELTTGYVYLYNYDTSAYDLKKTVTGNGTMNTVTIPLALDADGNNPYILNPGLATANVRFLIRAIKPARLGSAPFLLASDQILVQEKIPKS